MSCSRGISRIIAVLGQACRAIAGCLVIVASLVVFPSGVPWLIAAWLMAYTLLVLRGRSGLVCLGACAAVLVVKRLTPAPGLLGLIAVMLSVVVLGIVQARRDMPGGRRWFAWVSAATLWIAWAGMTMDWIGAAHTRHPVVLQAARPVVCIGDSMTSLGLFGGYPRDLAERITLPVVNLGIGGISASQAIDCCLPDLAGHNPQVVVVELGGHDFLRGYSRASTKASLTTIIAAARGIGAEVVLMEIPRAYMSDPYWGLEREIARQEDVELIADTAMRTVFLRSSTFPPGTWLGEPYLTDESGIHANARGNRILAESVAEALQRLYGAGIRK
jgi:acyl-CoA thioesterase I